jgi:DNA-binding CsgD family transcriptional regulator
MTAAVFLITPLWPQDLFGAISYELIAISREAGTLLFAISAWVSVFYAAKITDIPISLAAGILIVILGSSALGGLGLSFLPGSELNPLGSLFLCVYLMAIALLLAKSHQQSAEVLEKNVFEQYLRGRCGRIATEYKLTPREKEILFYMGRGHTYIHIAEVIYVSENTIRTHARNIFKKLGISSREELLSMIDGK